MSIRSRILLGFLVLVAAGFYFLIDWVLDDLRPRYLESVEETLVDASNALSAVLATRVRDGVIDTSDFRAAFEEVRRRVLSAKIYRLIKTGVDIRVYVTDARGIVIFDSDGGKDEGKDYSKWNDVYRTLHGQYGARPTRRVPDDPRSSVLYVAAPVVWQGRTIGALTVCKPTDSLHAFLDMARLKIIRAGVVAGISVVLLGILFSMWITRPVEALTAYARAVRDGRRVALPDLGRGEIGVMGKAMEEMRDALEGKKYVERYVQTLTHEVKSPLSAIRGAAELLEEEMPPERRARFLANIRTEAGRIQAVVDRLLQLSELEGRKGPRDVEPVDLAEVAAEAVESFAPVFEADRIALRNETAFPQDAHTPPATRGIVRAERFLIRLAVANLLQNAADFTPPGGTVTLSLAVTAPWAELVVDDTGPGVPDFALDRVFERFYSLPRPETGRKSSGLGLSLVREIARLHGGEATLENRPGGGARASLRLPLDGAMPA